MDEKVGRANRRCGLWLCAAAALGLASCESGGHFTLFGYTTQPNYDLRIHTVRVPIFQNRTFRRGVEFELTQAVVDALGQFTPYTVVSANCDADTELTGTIITDNKVLITPNQLNEVREAEVTLTVEVVWKNLRTGEILSRPTRRPFEPLPPQVLDNPLTRSPVAPILSPPTAPTGTLGEGAPSSGASDSILPPPAPPEPGPKPPATVIRSIADFRPELGETWASAQKRICDRMAVQIVSMMEKSW
jgi:hypothetical protein